MMGDESAVPAGAEPRRASFGASPPRGLAVWTHAIGRRAVLIAGITVLAYYAAAKLGVGLAHADGGAAAIWPPAGIALAAVLIGGYRMLPAVALGALLANIATPAPFTAVIGITLGNTLEALLGAALLRRVGFRPSLPRIRDVVALVGLAGVISTAVGATIGISSLYFSGRCPAVCSAAPGSFGGSATSEAT